MNPGSETIVDPDGYLDDLEVQPVRHDFRILFVTNRPPYPPMDGGRQRTNLLCRALQCLGRVDTVFINDGRPSKDEHRKIMQERFGLVDEVCPTPMRERTLLRHVPGVNDRVALHLTPRRIDYSPDRRVAAVIDKLAREHRYDLFFSRYLRPAAHAGLIGRHPLIVDIDDLDTDVYASRASATGQRLGVRLVAWHHYRQLRRLVPKLLREVDLGLVTSVDDSERLQDVVPTWVVPNIPYTEGDEPPAVEAPSTGKTILFMGSLSYPVNRRALIRFAEHVWPSIHRSEPDACLRVVGSGTSDELRNRLSMIEGVEPVGIVDDVTPEYERCAFSIVPIYEGGGTKIKIGESLQRGRSVVVTRHSYRGYDELVPSGNGLYVADTEAEFAEICLGLLADPAERNRQEVLGMKIARRWLGFGHFRSIVANLVDAYLTSPSS